MRYDPRQLTNYFNRLAPRERLLVGVALVSLVLISLYSFVWDPLQVSRQQLARRITAKEKDLIEIQKQRDTYLDLRRKLDANQAAIQRQEDANFSLFTYVDTIIGQALGREHVTSMNPSDKNISAEFQETMVEIRLTQINLGQLVDLLYKVEKGDHPLRFSRLQIKKRINDIHNFDVTATVSLLKVVSS
jgi:type II secretion system (T2SS) protein M